VWQDGPSASTRYRTTSASQSTLTSRTRSPLPDDSPLRQSAWRERLQNVASPVASVCSSASRLAQANIRIIPVRASCAITGTNPAASNETAASSASDFTI